MKKTFLYSLLVLTAVMLFADIPSAEARGHRRSNTNVQVNVGNCYDCNDAYVVRRYARPAPVYVQPVYVQPAYYAPAYAPAYAYAPPAYMEEVYVAPVRRPFALGGLSFSWNFFR